MAVAAQKMRINEIDRILFHLEDESLSRRRGIIRAMRIAVVGVGGVGGYFGGRLARAGEDVVFIARGRTLEALRSRGLRVDSINGDFLVHPVNATDHAASVGVVDAIIVATKAWQVHEAASEIAAMVGSETIVVPL